MKKEKKKPESTTFLKVRFALRCGCHNLQGHGSFPFVLSLNEPTWPEGNEDEDSDKQWECVKSEKKSFVCGDGAFEPLRKFDDTVD